MHKWTEAEDELLKAGGRPAGLTNKQCSYRRKVLGCLGKGGRKPIEWSPAMDLAIIDTTTGKLRKDWKQNPLVAHLVESTVALRQQFLRREYVMTGWGSLIGTQKIFPCDCGEDKEL